MASKEETVAATKRVLRCALWRVMWCVMRCLIDKQLIIKQYRTYL